MVSGGKRRPPPRSATNAHVEISEPDSYELGSRMLYRGGLEVQIVAKHNDPDGGTGPGFPDGSGFFYTVRMPGGPERQTTAEDLKPCPDAGAVPSPDAGGGGSNSNNHASHHR